MEKENKKATASEKLTKVVAIRISQTDYDIFLEKAKMEYETGGKGLLIGSDVQILTAGFENIIKDIKTMLEK